MRPLLPFLAAATWLTLGTSSALAAPTVDFQIIGPATAPHGSQVTMALQYSVTGDDLQDLVLVYDLPAGLVPTGASSTGDFVTDCQSQEPTYNRDWTCTFTAASLAVPPGGVSGQIALTTKLVPFMFGNGEVIQSSATFEATYGPAATVVGPLASTHDITTSGSLSFNENLMWSVNIYDYAFRADPNGDVGVVTELYYALTQVGDTRIEPGAQLVISLPPHGRYISGPPPNNSGFSAFTIDAVPTKWQSGDITLTFSSSFGESRVDECDGFACDAIAASRNLLAPVQVWLPCPDLATPPATPSTVTFTGDAPGITTGVETLVTNNVVFAQSGQILVCGDPLAVAAVAVQAQTIGMGQDGAMVMRLTPPIGEVPVTNAFASMRLPEQIIPRSANLNFGSVTGKADAPNGFQLFGCTVPSEAGPLDLTTFQGTYQATACTELVVGDEDLPADTTHLVMFAANWQGTDADGAYVAGPVSAYFSYTNDQCDSNDDEVYQVAAEATITGGSQTATNTFVRPVQDAAYPFVFGTPGNNGVVTRGTATTVTLLPRHNTSASPLMNPEFTIDVPAGVTLTGLTAPSLNPLCQPTVSATDALTWSGPAVGPATVTLKVGSSATPYLLDEGCENNTCGGGVFTIKADLFFDGAYPFINGQQVPIVSTLTADNPKIGAPPSVPAIATTTATFTVQVPGEMRVVVAPTCATENSWEGFNFSIENVGGIALDDVVLTVPVPAIGDGSGSAADMQFVATAGGGIVECRTGAGLWGAVCDSSTTEVRVTYASLPPHTTVDWNLYLTPSGVSTPGELVRALGQVTTSSLLSLELQPSAPLKIQECPGALHVDGWYDGDLSGDRQITEQGLKNWTVALTDQATSIVTSLSLPASGIVDTTLAPGVYDVVVMPTSNEPTWSFTTTVVASLTISSGGSAEILIGVGCSCDDGKSCSTDSCSPTGQCVYDFPVEGCCGNGELDDGEICDDGNYEAWDGCSDCQCSQYGWELNAVGVCVPICGDGLLMGDEVCDDANTVDGDGCSSACLVENNFACVDNDDSCMPAVVCGADLPTWCSSAEPQYKWCSDLGSSSGANYCDAPIDCSGPSTQDCVAANGGDSDNCQTAIVCDFCDHIGPSVCSPNVEPCDGAEALAISCPSPPADTLECTGTTTDVALAAATTTGGCGTVSLSDDAPASYALGATTVNYSATDETPATQTCETVVTVVDTTAPVVVCPADVTVDATPSTCAATLQLDDATATDVCDAGALATSDAPASFPLGASTVTFEATDASGNAATCETVVTVNVPPPALTCEAAVALSAPAQTCGATQVLTATYAAGCGPAASLGVDSDVYPIGSTDVDFQVEVTGGDPLTCTTVVTVQDVTPPTVDCNLGTGTATFVRSWPFRATGSGVDACGVTVVASAARCLAADGSEVACEATLEGASVTFAEPADAANIASVVWTVTATDASGLTATEDCSADMDLASSPNETPVCEPEWTLNEDGVCDRILANGGGGCSSSNSQGAPLGVVLALLALVGLAIGRRTTARGLTAAIMASALTLTVVVPADAQAQSGQGHVPAQLFQIAPGGAINYLGTESIRPLGHIEPSFGLSFNYAYQPLVLTRQSNGEQVELLEHQLQADVTAAIGFFDVIELGLAMPVTLYQQPGNQGQTVSPASLSSTVVGDLFIGLKAKLFGPKGQTGFGMGLLAGLTVPTGSAQDLQGNGGLTIEPRVLAEYVFSPQVRLAAGIGYKIRLEKQALYNIEVGNEVTYSMGFEWQPLPRELAVLLDLTGRIGADPDLVAGFEERPSELALAARWWPAENHALTFGVGRGLSQGYGAPAVRGFIGYQFTPMPDHDRDNDGLADDVDACPDDPEDFDQFEDTDGCPELDNDKDGIVDTEDKCPLKPEDKDGFEDADGCPELDNDGDGILDSVDQCPLKPEDKDGFQDTDGCPEDDNDGDGILDAADKCPNEPEDKDGFQDTDGCPEDDNDGDGLLDADDPCPQDPTNACKAVKKGKKIIIYDKVHFKYNKAVIKKKSYPVLDDVLDILKKNPAIKKVQVQGHTDSDGNDAFNLKLSDRRAAAVVAYLVKRGIAASRLSSIGYGERRAIKPNNTKANRAENRRVEFHILDSGDLKLRPKK